MHDLVTAASHTRLTIARTLAEQCPPDLGREIAVTGSVARGVADDYSDIELNLWSDMVPALDDRRAWLEDAGATDFDQALDEEDSFGFSWMVCGYRGVWIEAGWASLDRFDAFVRDLAAGAFIDHDPLQMGWTICRARSLRTEGRLAQWQEMLAHYPDGLAERVIADQTAVWSLPHVPGVRWALAARKERMGLALRLTWDARNILRVLFALNRTWDRDLKWTDERSLDLPLKPDRLSERIDAIFTLTDIAQAVEIDQALIIDTLELAQDQGFDVDAALQSVCASRSERSGHIEGIGWRARMPAPD